MLPSAIALAKLRSREPFLWLNPGLRPATRALPALSLRKSDLLEADQRLKRFAPLLAKLFPETAPSGGIIESALIPAAKLTRHFRRQFALPLSKPLLIKADHALPVAGSIKARGGLYEVLFFAEKLARQHGLLGGEGDDYTRLLAPGAKKLFRHYILAVGSTGNLGLSIGIAGAALGFRCEVHMSVEAKAWKKARLRRHGVKVIEHATDYTDAVKAGRQAARTNPFTYFVDDENSVPLFLGYSVAALRLQKQLARRRIAVDEAHPLFVYIPCGVGGAPAGINFGLKQVFGDVVHVFFAEPVAAPCMLLGLLTNFRKNVSVYDLGLAIDTDADGLAVSRASALAGKLIRSLVSGCFTVTDQELYRHLYHLFEQEQIKIEPSAAAGFTGPVHLLKSAQGKAYLRAHRLERKLANARHLLWTTGGLFVPENEYKKFHEKGRQAGAFPQG